MDTIMKTEEAEEEELKPLSTSSTTSIPSSLPSPRPSTLITSESSSTSSLESTVEPTPSKEEEEEEEKESFKIPNLPTLPKSIPPDIAHIIALGLNEPDPMDLNLNAENSTTSNYEEVVRALKESAGFSTGTSAVAAVVSEGEGDSEMKEGPGGGESSELGDIEEEMRKGGVLRPSVLYGTNVVEVEVEVEMDSEMIGAQDEIIRPSSPTPSESSDSSDSSSSSDDPDIEARLVPSTSQRTSPSTSTSTSTILPLSKNAKKRQLKKKNAAANSANNNNNSGDSDLSDEDVNTSSTAAPKTEHEVVQPLIELPKLTKLSEESVLTSFGKVMSVIDSVVVIKADTAGDWRVLDEGCLCCWEDKTVIGNIFETFGSVIQPFYSIRFPPTSLPDPEIFIIGKSVYYCAKMASFVFTQDLRGLKGSDASNVWDEEIGAAEMEWSDDEQEQEFKRSQKNDRRSRTASMTPGPQSNRNTPGPSSSRQNSRAPSSSRASSVSLSHSLPPRPIASALPYDDDVYTPLQRPSNLHLMNESNTPSSSSTTPLTTANMGSNNRKMFERNTRGGEFEFSDNDGNDSEDLEAETGSISSTFEVDERYRAMDELDRENEEREKRKRRDEFQQQGSSSSSSSNSRGGSGESGRGRGGRGGDRGRGSVRGRGRGNSEGESFRGGRGGAGRGRGGEESGRGRGGGNDRGTVRGGRGGLVVTSRPVAPLPNRPVGFSLPAKPAFSESTFSGEELRLNSQGISNSEGGRGGGVQLPMNAGLPSLSPPVNSTSTGNLNPLPPLNPSNPSKLVLPPPPPPPGSQLPMYQFNPAGFQPNFGFPILGNGNENGNGNRFPQFPQFPPSFFSPPPNSSSDTSGLPLPSGPIPVQGGHFNPRFLAGNVAGNVGGGGGGPPAQTGFPSNPYFQPYQQQQHQNSYPQQYSQQYPQQQQSSYHQQPNYQQQGNNNNPRYNSNHHDHNRQGSWNGNNNNNYNNGGAPQQQQHYQNQQYQHQQNYHSQQQQQQQQQQLNNGDRTGGNERAGAEGGGQ